jgi:SHS2 domain-containing protein
VISSRGDGYQLKNSEVVLIATAGRKNHFFFLSAPYICYYIVHTMGYELIEHTADIGIRVWADDVKGLFEGAARGLFDIITDIGTVAARIERSLTVRGSGWEEVMVAWLTELLYLHEVKGLLFCDFSIAEADQVGLTGVARGERFNEKRHPIKTIVKAVTYHQLQIRKQDGHWHARIIFDI